MADWFEIDFLDVETAKSGDAIAMQYEAGGVYQIHVVDGGFTAMGDRVVDHMYRHYSFLGFVNHVVVSHPDGDHACGLRTILERCEVGTLWMLRPWMYAQQLLPYFSTYNDVQSLERRLRQIYPYIADLEEIALRRYIPIEEPFQGRRIGAFSVMAPSPARYGRLILESEKTPETVDLPSLGGLLGGFQTAGAQLWNFLKGAWGYEVFSPNETSSENEMSVVQFAEIGGAKILLTADAGRAALTEAADYAPWAGLSLPGIDYFQVPHHGSRRNVSTEILDRWLGPRLSTQPVPGHASFTAICSSAKADAAHPRKSVERAFCHRGAKFMTTEDGDKYIFRNRELRDGWHAVPVRSYPDEYEA